MTLCVLTVGLFRQHAPSHLCPVLKALLLDLGHKLLSAGFLPPLGGHKLTLVDFGDFWQTAHGAVLEVGSEGADQRLLSDFGDLAAGDSGDLLLEEGLVFGNDSHSKEDINHQHDDGVEEHEEPVILD